MRKVLFVLILFSLLFVVLPFFQVQAASLVPCGQGPPGTTRCELSDIFLLILNVYNFIVWTIATPLAGILVVLGGITMIFAAGNPNLASTAKRILWGAFIGWLLIWCAWLIINTVFLALGLSYGSFP